MKRLKITHEMLVSFGACEPGRAVFKKLFPNGLIVSDDQEFNCKILERLPEEGFLVTYSYEDGDGEETEYIYNYTVVAHIDWLSESLGMFLTCRIDWSSSYYSFGPGIEGAMVMLTDAVGMYLSNHPEAEYRPGNMSKALK